jgi:hypothetical protein
MSRITSYVLLGISVLLLGFNLFTLDYHDILGKDSRGAFFGALANVCVMLVVFINLTSQKIKEKVDQSKD